MAKTNENHPFIMVAWRYEGRWWITQGAPLINLNYSQHGELISCPALQGMKLFIHFQTSTAPPLKFENG